MKKLITIILTLFMLFINGSNIANANTKMIASAGDYKIDFVTLNPNTFGVNDFYYGQKLSNLISFMKVYTINNDVVDVKLYWENPDYELVYGYQFVDVYFIDENSGNKSNFTVGIYCDISIRNIKPLRILP